MDWIEILPFTCSASGKVEGYIKCAVRALDTVTFDKSTCEPNWYFTNKSGNISKKKNEKASLSEFAVRCAKFAFANPMNTEKLTAMVFNESGSSQTINENELSALLNSAAEIERLARSHSFIQVYIRPLNGEDIVFVCQSKKNNDKTTYKHEILALKRHQVEQSIPSKLAVINDQIAELSNEMIHCLSHNMKVSVDELTCEYIVDDNSHAWLSRVARCVVSATDQSSTNNVSPTTSRQLDDIYPLPQNQSGDDSVKIGIADTGMSTGNLDISISQQPVARSVSASNALPSKLRGTTAAADQYHVSTPPDEADSKQVALAKIYGADVLNADNSLPNNSNDNANVVAHQLKVGGNKLGIKRDILERKKKKKDKAGNSGSSVESVASSGFKRNKMDEPPSFELMAKFAAEKDWQEKQLHSKSSKKKASKVSSPLRQQQSALDLMLDGDDLAEDESWVLENRQQLSGLGRSSKKSPKKSASVGHLPPSGGDMSSSERRLQELEKLAASTATIKSFVNQQQRDSTGLDSYVPSASQLHSSIGSRSNMMSGTEADFLVRQINTADVSQLSLFSNLDEFETVAPAAARSQFTPLQRHQSSHNDSFSGLVNGGGSVSSTKDIMHGAFTERIASLEKQLATLQAVADKKELEIEKRDTRLKRLTIELETSKKDANNDLKRLQSEHEVEILRIREQNAKDKAILATAMSAADSNNSNSSSPLTKHSSAENGSKLIEQLEALRMEQRRQQDGFADERRNLQIDYSNKLLVQERKYKSEIMELKSSVAVLEDKIVTFQEQHSVSLGSIQQLRNLNAQLESAKREAVEQQSRLRADIKNMQQSVQASYRLETSQQLSSNNSGVAGTDPDSIMRLNDAKNEAKSRQLMNKIEFLKSQLEAEKKSNDELKQSADALKGKLDEIRDEFRFRMQEAERAKALAVEEAEQRVEAQYEERMREFTALQAKVMSLNSQLHDVSSEHLLARQQEEKQRQTAMKQLAVAAALKTELEQQRALVAQLRDEREAETLKESGKQNNDAIIRRLDNERQYLKSQLTSEITHKNEMQSELHKCTAQNKEIQKQWSDDVASLKDTLQSEQHKFREKEQQFRQVETSLGTELNSTKQQLKELKEGFVKTRDALRMEQLNSENTVTANRRLAEQLELAHTDIAQLKSLDAQSAVSYQQQIEAINATIREQESAHKRELQSLKEELGKQYALNSSEQVNILDLREQHAREKLGITKLVHASSLAHKLNKWRCARIYTAFRIWNTNSTLVSVAGQFRGQVEEMLRANSDDLAREQTRALEAQAKKLHKEHSVAVSLLKSEFDDTLHQTIQRCDDDKQSALEAAEAEHQAQVQQLETDFSFDTANARKEAELELMRLAEQKEKAYAALQQKHREQSTAAKDLAHEQLLRAVSDKEDEMNELWRDNLADRERELETRHQKTLSGLQVDHDFQLHSKMSEHKQELAKLATKHELLLQETVEQLEAKFAQATEELNRQKELELKQLEERVRGEEALEQQRQRAEMHEATEGRIRELRLLWQLEFDEKVAKAAADFEAKLAEKMEEYSRSVEADKQRAVKLEGSKWKQALKDVEQANELHAMKLRSEVSQQKDAECKVELERANNRFEMLKQKDFQLHLQVIEDIKNDHRAAFERQANLFELQCEELRLEVETAVKQEYDEVWGEKLKQLLLDSENNWKSRVTKEKDKVQTLRNDLSQQASAFASERSTLQRAVNNCDERVAQMEAMNKSELLQLRADFEAGRELMKLQELDAAKAQRVLFDAEKVQLGEEIEIKFKVISDNSIAFERDKLNAEFEKQMASYQEESERLVAGLESALAGLKREKTELANSLEAVTVKLEDTEDSLYDLQQEHKKAIKEHSFALWRAAASAFQMQTRFQRGITDFDAEAQKRFHAMKREMQGKVDDSVLLAFKLAALLQEVEVNRKRSHTTLTAFKTDVILAKRSAIQLLERELERLTLEKDSLEEQREMMETDIVQMEVQVRELEEQIREHNRESSMTNGRINVAHARKKRRLDSELERLLESIEQKRLNVSVLDGKLVEKAGLRDEKELDMIDVEKALMAILLEQQKQLVVDMDENKTIEDRCKMLMRVARLPFPVSASPTLEEVVAHHKERERQEERE